MAGEDKVFKKRLIGFFVISVMVLLVLMSRLFHLQIVKGEHYQKVSEENRLRNVSITPPRGEIFDNNGEVLARNSPGYTVSLMDVPEQDEDEFIEDLGELLDLEEESIKQKMESQRYRRFEPVPLKSNVDYETITYLEEKRQKYPGVVIEVAPVRSYPHEEHFSHLLGWMGEISEAELEGGMKEKGYIPGDYVGKSGIEETYENYLSGEEGIRQIEVNRFGSIVSEIEQEEPEPGKNLHLSVDLELQKDLTRALENAREEAKEDIIEEEGLSEDEVKKRGAAGIVLDPNSGRVLSKVSLPGYNPETFSSDYSELISHPLNPIRDRNTRETYAPGSTFKMVSAIAALEEGEISSNETINDRGSYWNPPYPSNYGGIAHGRIDIIEALSKSSNVFFAELGNRLGIEALSSWAEKFGFGSQVGFQDMGREIGGMLASPRVKQQIYEEPQHRVWFPGDTINASLGQGYNSFTPIQMVNYASMIANRGVHYRPYVVEKIKDGEEIVEENSPEILNEINVSEQNWDLVHEGMRNAARPGGTAGQLATRIPFDVAVKTGTSERGRGEADSWVVGFAPYEDPEIAFALLVEGGGVAGSRLTPTTVELLNSYFDLDLDEEELEELEREVERTGDVGY